MAQPHNDWSWKPDEKTLIALRRGEAKLVGFRVEAREALIDLRADRGKRVSKKEAARRELEQNAIRKYLHQTKRLEKSKMAWATVILLEGVKTRVFQRYNKLETAVRAAECEPEAMKAPDYLVISAGTDLKMLDVKELAALAKEAKLGAKLERPAMEKGVKDWLATVGEEQDDLTDAGRKNAEEPGKKALLGTVKVNGAALAEETPTPKGKAPKGKKGKEKAPEPAPAARPKGKASKKLAPRVAKVREAKGDGLGREGTLTRFMCEGIMSGRDDAKLLAEARKKFPKNKITDGYPKWYRNSLVKKGLLKAPKK